MPSMPWRVVFFALWIVATSWWIARDVAPRWFAGRFEYRQLLSQRASDEPTMWRILLDGRKVGSILSNVHPAPDGSFSIRSQAAISSSLIPNLGADAEIEITFRAEITPLGRLETFEARVRLEGSQLDFTIRGRVAGEEATVAAFAGRQQVGEVTKLRLDSQLPIGQSLAPVDRLPDLWVGRTWTTKTVDPQSILMGGGLFGGGTVNAKDAVHTVLGTETIIWNQSAVDCFIVEDRQDGITGKTWVRKSDGQVLRQEAGFGSSQIVMELDPQTFKSLR